MIQKVVASFLLASGKSLVGKSLVSLSLVGISLVSLALAGVPPAFAAEPFSVKEAPSAVAVAPSALTPRMVVISDHREDPLADQTGLMRFDAWARERPEEKSWLNIHEGYGDPSPDAAAKKAARDNPYMYVVEARFMIPRPPSAIDLGRFATLAFMEKIDPAITHKTITRAQTGAFGPSGGTYIRNPVRPWCEVMEGGPKMLCIQSRYQLEGRLPMGIRLANNLTDSARKIPDHLDFQSELRVLDPDDLNGHGIQKLLKLDMPAVSGVQQSIFYVNQVLQFGKVLAVLQPHPDKPDASVVTAFMTLAIKASVLERQRQYQKVPILRNLVPAQVLMGKSTFNEGKSISAGLPNYTRNSIAAIATMLEQE